MKKIFSLLLAVLMLLSAMSFGFAEKDNELPARPLDEIESEEPVFEITDAYFDGSNMSGAVNLISGELADEQNLFVRVVFFFEGNSYLAASSPVASDGTFEMQISSPLSVECITIAAFGAKRLRDENKTLFATKVITY